MNNTNKLIYSLIVGIVATGIAKLVHPRWGIDNLLTFGIVVFAVTALLSLLIKREKK